MKKLAVAVLMVLPVVLSVRGQDLSRTYTEPCVPPREVLERLNLQMAWRVFLPTERRRDRLFTIQVLDNQVLVQTLSGSVIALDSLTGATQWRTRIGAPYAVTQPLGYNSTSVFAINGTRLYVLNRANGQLLGDFTLPYAPSSPVAADDFHAYVPMGTGRMYAFRLPVPPPLAVGRGEAMPEAAARRSGFGVSGRAVTAVGPLSSAVAAGQEPSAGPQLLVAWDYQSDTRHEQAPLLAGRFVLLAGVNGTFRVLSKLAPREFYRHTADARAAAPLGQYGDTAYMAATDYNVYAMDIVTGQILWRFLAGGAMPVQPAVTDEDVYIAPERAGLHRLNRLTGQAVWRNLEASRFLAMNPKFVYAMDRSNRLLILDRARGSTLTGYECTWDFVVPVANEVTDRIFLASNDGLIVCLHDRDYATPLRVKTVREQPPPPMPGEPVPPPEKTDGMAPEM